MRATWKGVVVAESDDTIRIEGNEYFPPDSINWDALAPSATTSRCWWKGKAHYYDVVADDTVNPDAAWSYPEPWPLARKITGYVAFWNGVSVEP